MIPHPLIAQLAEIRRRRRLSQQQAADLAGLSVSTLGGWERGVTVPTLAALQCYLDALEVRVVAIPADAPAPVYDRPAGEQIPFGQLALGEGEKWCPDCQRALSKAEFTRDRSRRDGLAWRCRACNLVYQSKPARQARAARRKGAA